MSAKIKISYDYHPELLDVLAKLGKSVASVKQAQAEGNRRLAYIKLEPLTSPAKRDTMEA